MENEPQNVPPLNPENNPNPNQEENSFWERITSKEIQDISTDIFPSIIYVYYNISKIIA